MRGVRLLVPLLLFAISCGTPRDPRDTLEHARGRVLRVGIAEDPPFVTREGTEPRGPDAERIRGFARSLGANVQWMWGSQENNLQALHDFDVDLVAGGIREKTPWKSKVAVTRPFDGERVLAAPPGENAFMVALEKYLAAHRSKP
jgi:polar amino acid transport system substrate-binding protein